MFMLDLELKLRKLFNLRLSLRLIRSTNQPQQPAPSVAATRPHVEVVQRLPSLPIL
jgi:hypothetical protein